MSATEQPRTLLLWDIDHTLIETRGVGRAIYERAFPAATGRPLTELAAISGLTELGIMSESLRLNGLDPTEHALRRLATALTQGYTDAAEELARIGRALPGARRTLAAFARDPRLYQGVLTGNLRAVARTKLKVFGLDRHLDLEASAYGDDNANRARLVQIAQRRASERTATSFDNSRTILIGDTPNDIQAALTAGVRAIGVTTGTSTETDLRAAGATAVTAQLSPDLIDVLVD